jgi:hypothetical protein
MTLAIAADKWVGFLETEYLQSYVKAGGAAIKFAVPLEDELVQRLVPSIEARAAQLGYIVAHIDSGETRVHMIDQLFFAIAQQVPWRESVRRVVEDIAAEEGYAPANPGNEPYLRRLAETNGLDPSFLRMELRRKISQQVFRHRDLAKDFRVAMTHLAVAELGGAEEGVTVYSAILDWLCGRNRSVSAVKPYQIFSRITRANARFLLESLLVWLASAGYAGLTLVIDLQRVSVARNPRDELVYYTKAGVLDAYELLRQFIDATDRLRNCLIVVVPHRDFLDEDFLGRGIGAYEALKFRIYDEVRDRRLVNPMASLVRVTSVVGAE